MSLGSKFGSQNQFGSGVAWKSVQPYLYGTEDDLVSQIRNLMLGGANPTIQGMKTAATNQVNQNYAAAPRTIAARLSGLGFGKSGKLGTAMYNTEASRLNDLSNVNSTYDSMALNEQNTGSSLAEQLLNETMGGGYSNQSYGATSETGVGTPGSFRL